MVVGTGEISNSLRQNSPFQLNLFPLVKWSSSGILIDPTNQAADSRLKSWVKRAYESKRWFVQGGKLLVHVTTLGISLAGFITTLTPEKVQLKRAMDHEKYLESIRESTQERLSYLKPNLGIKSAHQTFSEILNSTPSKMKNLTRSYNEERRSFLFRNNGGIRKVQTSLLPDFNAKNEKRTVAEFETVEEKEDSIE